MLPQVVSSVTEPLEDIVSLLRVFSKPFKILIFGGMLELSVVLHKKTSHVLLLRNHHLFEGLVQKPAL